MNRYLLNIAYIGTKFRLRSFHKSNLALTIRKKLIVLGIQKTINKADIEPQIDTKTIQGCIELALQHLHPVNPITVHLSSRTDAGVHALNSTVHVDLQNSRDDVYSSERITLLLNRIFNKHNYHIRVLKTSHVPESFHCRYSAKARTYIYRFAVVKNKENTENYIAKNLNFVSYIPIEDLERCLYVQNRNFDINSLEKSSKLFIGKHDFRTFMSTSKEKERQNRPRFCVRSISSITIKESVPPINYYELEKSQETYNYYNIEITGRTFLYKQVRRIVGSLIALGTGLISEKDIYEMLTIPSKNTWHPKVVIAPAFALYLAKVHYDESDLKFTS